MTLFNRSIAILSVGFGLVITGFVPLSAAGNNWFQVDPAYNDLRGIIDRTQNDLQAAAQLEQNEKERDRYKNTQRKLSDLDRALSKGHFDKGRLDGSIKDIENILNHNTLQPSTRDALRSDVTGLKIARDRR